MHPRTPAALQDTQHVRAIEALVRDLKLPPDLVKAAYEAEVRRIGSDAKVATFVSIFARRRARVVLAAQAAHLAEISKGASSLAEPAGALEEESRPAHHATSISA